jgi:hypothetical protein
VIFLFFLPLLLFGSAQAASHCCLAFGNYEGCASSGHQEPGGGGGGGGPAGPPAPTPDPTYKNDGSLYSYDAGCANEDEIDPVTTVLLNAGEGVPPLNTPIVFAVLADINWDRDAPLPIPWESTLQHFKDNGGCDEGVVSRATNDGAQNCGDPAWPFFGCPQSRWHIRCDINSDVDGQGRTFANCTPHRDKAINKSCWHEVPPVYDGDEPYVGDGFSAARERLLDDLLDAGHTQWSVQYWNNKKKMKQCTDAWTGSDGYVNIIDIGN